MKKLWFWLLVLGVCFFAKGNAFSQQTSGTEQELGKISIMIHDFEYCNEPEGISWCTANRLGPPHLYRIRIYPASAGLIKNYRNMLEQNEAINQAYGKKVAGDFVFLPPKNDEDLIRILALGWPTEFPMRPEVTAKEFLVTVPAGEYFFDYIIEFENRMGINELAPRRRTMREDTSNGHLWGPLRITVSKGQTSKLDMRPTYNNSSSEKILSMEDFVGQYMQEVLNK